jgi:hypothetical protein
MRSWVQSPVLKKKKRHWVDIVIVVMKTKQMKQNTFQLSSLSGKKKKKRSNNLKYLHIHKCLVTKEIEDMRNTISQLDLADIFRPHYPTSAHGTFFRIKLKKLETLCTVGGHAK